MLRNEGIHWKISLNRGQRTCTKRLCAKYAAFSETMYSPDPRGTTYGHRARRASNYMWSSKTDKASAQMSDAEEAWQCKEKKTAVKFLCIQCDRVVAHLRWWSISSILNGFCQDARVLLQSSKTVCKTWELASWYQLVCETKCLQTILDLRRPSNFRRMKRPKNVKCPVNVDVNARDTFI